MHKHRIYKAGCRYVFSYVQLNVIFPMLNIYKRRIYAAGLQYAFACVPSNAISWPFDTYKYRTYAAVPRYALSCVTTYRWMVWLHYGGDQTSFPFQCWTKPLFFPLPALWSCRNEMLHLRLLKCSLEFPY